MILLVSGATWYPRNESVGHLVVPRQWNDPDELDLQPGRWAMDNGCFTGLDEGAFVRMLYAYRKQTGCLFVTAPDKVADFAETRYLWKWWAPLIRATGHAPAFVAQNGLELRGWTPWDEMGALFVGGDNAFKEGAVAKTLCGIAKARGLWVHWGRVNGKRRYRLALEAGADSIDGTGFSMYPDTNIPKAAEWQQQITQEPSLFTAEAHT